MATIIWWIRRDLRLADNQALLTAHQRGYTVLPLFILDPRLLARPAEKRKAFLFSGLRALDHSLRSLGGRLIVRHGDPLQELIRIQQEVDAVGVIAEEDYSPYARKRDTAVANVLPLELTGGVTIHHPSAVVKPDGEPYHVFTPFSRTWKALPFPSSSGTLPLLHLVDSDLLDSSPIPDVPPPTTFPAGEKEAQRRLSEFISSRVFNYHQDRNRLDLEGTSCLSPYLRFGMISPRQTAQAIVKLISKSTDSEARQSCETWLNELIWREFYHAVLFHFPQVLSDSFNPGYRNISWRISSNDLTAWKEGKTGFPVVDACMRQLAALGWMHNRGRMITASFLTKDLLVNWQEGENWFMQQLVDGDPASNNGGWQWTAGVGTDAAPYFRIFNPVSQSQKFDPEGTFIRKWVPELAGVSGEYIHQPWLMPLEYQSCIGCKIGSDYPVPLVDHAFAKERTLNAYRKPKEI